MGERLKDEHRKPQPAPDSTATVAPAVVVAPPVQPVPPPAPPQWVPWTLHH
jgi:hypothetical protein